jgi:hypothetical protein
MRKHGFNPPHPTTHPPQHTHLRYTYLLDVLAFSRPTFCAIQHRRPDRRPIELTYLFTFGGLFFFHKYLTIWATWRGRYDICFPMMSACDPHKEWPEAGLVTFSFLFLPSGSQFTSFMKVKECQRQAISP